MGSAFLKSLAFGIFIAASIGPIALLIIGTAANRGLGPGSLAGLGAALADLVYAFLAFSAGAMLLPLLETWTVPIRVGSALVLIVLAVAMIRREFAAAALAPGVPPRPAGSLLGLVLPGRRWRRAINLAGAAGILAFGLAGLLSL